MCYMGSKGIPSDHVVWLLAIWCSFLLCDMLFKTTENSIRIFKGLKYNDIDIKHGGQSVTLQTIGV